MRPVRARNPIGVTAAMLAGLDKTVVVVAIHALLEVAVIVRVLLRPHREPASRIAWVAIIAVVPVAGMLAYLLFGEVSIGRRRAARLRRILHRMPELPIGVIGDEANLKAEVPERWQHLFRLGRSISGFDPVGGNAARLLPDSNATIDAIVEDVDAAQDHVHLLFYIWLPDNNGCKVVEALKRAARRGVKCRAMADNLGSRILIHSEHWKAMRDAGVDAVVALPIGNPLVGPLKGRIDLRNHRKIVVIDNRITYCGSQNCADLRGEGQPNGNLFGPPWLVRAVNSRLLIPDRPGHRENVWPHFARPLGALTEYP